MIGGGPAGLGAAIEAKLGGAHVTIVEKRKAYTREQYFFLWGASLGILKQWDVNTADFYLGYDDIDHELVGVAQIKKFERALEERVKELGIPKIVGAFKEIRNKKAVIIQNGQEIELPYDLLVGADGEHSVVREQLGIECRNLGKATGCIAVLDKKNPTLHFVLPLWSESLFINNISIPSMTIISGQSNIINQDLLAAAAFREGWTDEASLIASGHGIFFEQIPVSLQQALTFSNAEKSAILLGDAAGTASFLQGLGANTALEAAVVAGRFFTSSHTEADYAAYNQALQELTDRLISDSAFLFK